MLLLGGLLGGTAQAEVVDAGLFVGHPAVLETGLTTGLAAGYTLGEVWTAGLRLGWSTATEYTLTRSIRQDEVRLRAQGGAQLGSGAGHLGLRLSLGATAVYEVATRSQGERAGLTGDALEQTAWRLVPGGEVELVATLRVYEWLGVVVSGGPSLHVLEGSHPGFAAGVALAWLP